MDDNEKMKRGITVLVASTIINLTVGVLYAWSVLKQRLMSTENGGWGWSSSEAGFPYTLGILCFATGVLVGGRTQDKIGPRWVVTAGGFLVGAGLIVCSLVPDSTTLVTIGFGVMTGLGIGLAYSSVTPPVLKWFHSSKKGLVSGCTVGGFGFAAIFYAPLVASLFDNIAAQHGYEAAMQRTFLYIGLVIIAIGVSVAQLIKNPPAGHVPIEPKKVKAAVAKVYKDYTYKEMLRTKAFYMIHCLFVFAATIGLMIIGNVTKIADIQAGITNPTFLALLVSLIALMNGLGRMVGGIISDKIGRINTLYMALTLQMLNMIGFVFYNNAPTIVIGIFLAGLCYGVCVAVFTTLPADRFGVKNYGANYGFVFTAFGMAGVVAPLIADYFYDLSARAGEPSFNTAYWICAGLMPILIFVAYMLKKDMSKDGI